MQKRPTFGAWSKPRSLSIAFGYLTNQNLRNKFEKKNQLFHYGKTPVIQFSHMEKWLS